MGNCFQVSRRADGVLDISDVKKDGRGNAAAGRSVLLNRPIP
jgi:hypothetical protein